jgi:hypothetical protein
VVELGRSGGLSYWLRGFLMRFVRQFRPILDFSANTKLTETGENLKLFWEEILSISANNQDISDNVLSVPPRHAKQGVAFILLGFWNLCGVYFKEEKTCFLIGRRISDTLP